MQEAVVVVAHDEAGVEREGGVARGAGGGGVEVDVAGVVGGEDVGIGGVDDGAEVESAVVGFRLVAGVGEGFAFEVVEAGGVGGGGVVAVEERIVEGDVGGGAVVLSED